MATMPKADLDQFLETIGEAVMPLLSRSVVPILREEQGRPVQTGTGTLFRVASHHFLVTAAHVTNYCTENRLQPYICDATSSSPVVALEGTIHSERQLDVALWGLSTRVVEQLPNRLFLNLLYTDRARLFLGDGFYYLHGYPGVWSSADEANATVEAKAFTYGTTLYKGNTDYLDGYNPHIHMILAVSQNCSDGTKSGIRPTLPGRLQGISGSSIWKVYHEGTAPAAWSLDHVRIVGVQTGVYKSGAIVRGTAWLVVHQMLWRQYPELHPALSVITPP
jgi:hypothetical protein